MTEYPLLLSGSLVVCGYAAHVAIAHGALYYRAGLYRQHGWFSLFAVLVVMLLAAELLVARSHNLIDAQRALNVRGVTTLVAAWATVEFVAATTEVVPRLYSRCVGVFLLVAAAIAIFVPIHGTCIGLESVRLPLGEWVTVPLKSNDFSRFTTPPLHAALVFVGICVLWAGLVDARRAAAAGESGRAPLIAMAGVVLTALELVSYFNELRILRLPYMASLMGHAGVLLLLDLELARASRRQQRKVDQSLRRFSAIFENSDDGIVVFNRSGKPLVVNRAFRNLTMCTHGNRDSGCPCLSQGPIQDVFQQLLRAIGPSAQSAQLDLELPVASGGYVTVEARLTCIDWAGQKATLATLRDIHERLRGELERQRVERMLAVAQLSSGVAQDLRSVVHATRDFACIASNSTDPGVNEAGQALAQASDRATELVRGLLSLSSNRTQTREEYDVAEVVTNVVRLFRAAHRGAKLTALLPTPERWALLGAKAELESALLNLLFNAQQATLAGGHIELRCEALELAVGALKTAVERPSRAGKYLKLQVIDTGCGMADAVRERCFDSFFTTRGTRGTGLGLATIREVVRLSNGAVELESKLGVGTTVTLYLPLYRVRASAHLRLSAPPAGALPPGRQVDLPASLA